MSHCSDPDQEIKKLRALLRNKDEDLRRAKQEISQLQNSVYQSQIAQSSSPIVPDVSAIHNEFQLSSAAPPVTPFHQDGMSRSNTIPRSNGIRVHNRLEGVARSSNRQSSNAHAIKRARTMSQQAPVSQRMDRLGSNLSTQSAGPFTGHAPISPQTRIHSAGPQMRGAGMGDYVDRDESASSYGLAHSQSMRPSQSKHHHDMPTLSESGPMTTGVMLDPEVYFAQHPFHDEPPPSADTFGSSVPSQNHDVDVPQFNITNVSVCGSMTTAPTYDTAPMTRQNSMFDSQSVSGGVRMMSLGSQMSQGGEAYYHEASQQNSSSDSSPLGKRPYCSEDALIAVGSSLAPPFAHQYAASAPNDALLASDMERSVSSASMASTRSNSSLKARAKDTLKLQCQRALNAPLKPKPSTEQSATESQANAKKDGKTAIAKTKYVRPKQPKVYCNQCDEHKEGFRGEHELRRHKDAKHQATVRKWICVDPAAHGLPINIPAVNPLSKCKACKAQKKYGAYYNAAAHLRRTHFKEKPSRQKNKGHNNNNNNRGEEDKRGGKGGGDWPAMSELKNWMKEVLVSKYEPDDEDDGDEDASHQAMDIETGGMEPYPTDFSMPHRMTNAVFADMDYSNLVVNPDVSYMTGMPLSSADFNFNNAMSPSFAPDLSAMTPQDQMNQFSSALSSSATVTPMTAYHEVSHGDEFDFNMVYSQ